MGDVPDQIIWCLSHSHSWMLRCRDVTPVSLTVNPPPGLTAPDLAPSCLDVSVIWASGGQACQMGHLWVNVFACVGSKYQIWTLERLSRCAFLGEVTYFLVLIYVRQSISSLSKAAYERCVIPTFFPLSTVSGNCEISSISHLTMSPTRPNNVASLYPFLPLSRNSYSVISAFCTEDNIPQCISYMNQVRKYTQYVVFLFFLWLNCAQTPELAWLKSLPRSSNPGQLCVASLVLL